MNSLDIELLDKAFHLLAARLDIAGLKAMHIIVCGGSALIATGLLVRTTKDVDVLAVSRGKGSMMSARPIPEEIRPALESIARDLGLMDNWFNCGPADLFEMGMPEGYEERLIEKTYGSHLTVSFVGRVDQIHFKLYASVDRGGYHVDDLQKLVPSSDEIEAAARWAMTHDVSEGFRIILKDMLKKLDYESVADNI